MTVKRLEAVLESVSGNTWADGHVPPAEVPKISHNDRTFDLSNPTDIKALVELCSAATCGKGSTEVMAPKIRRCLQTKDVEVSFPGIDRVLRQVESTLTPFSRLSADFYQLLVYRPGDFFVSHRDTKKSEDHILTLAVDCGSQCKGGELIFPVPAQDSPSKSQSKRGRRAQVQTHWTTMVKDEDYNRILLGLTMRLEDIVAQMRPPGLRSRTGSWASDDDADGSDGGSDLRSFCGEELEGKLADRERERFFGRAERWGGWDRETNANPVYLKKSGAPRWESGGVGGSWCCWLNSVFHELEKVTEGFRVVAIYNVSSREHQWNPEQSRLLPLAPLTVPGGSGALLHLPREPMELLGSLLPFPSFCLLRSTSRVVKSRLLMHNGMRQVALAFASVIHKAPALIRQKRHFPCKWVAVPLFHLYSFFGTPTGRPLPEERHDQLFGSDRMLYEGVRRVTGERPLIFESAGLEFSYGTYKSSRLGWFQMQIPTHLRHLEPYNEAKAKQMEALGDFSGLALQAVRWMYEQREKGKRETLRVISCPSQTNVPSSAAAATGIGTHTHAAAAAVAAAEADDIEYDGPVPSSDSESERDDSSVYFDRKKQRGPILRSNLEIPDILSVMFGGEKTVGDLMVYERLPHKIWSFLHWADPDNGIPPDHGFRTALLPIPRPCLPIYADSAGVLDRSVSLGCTAGPVRGHLGELRKRRCADLQVQPDARQAPRPPDDSGGGVALSLG
uniref:Fe2OG dioxygenase domain-containing protein n=1 Tax=Chromera velia CCMP2878 TaxID=1169474 RepID=A0A0G4G294_9ALVE|eukprot:Cvel_19908.t1-p1 / transcript=Cvel_19908.t1 / gene=Cvel_19908 / organism=Chromera_velia_CCMP2878 / gene_product=hypothetical protein / transcript_product=hypothetical protein / location=Cvel_scaffold1750:15422-17611(-) / protein_length=730 / sequence_SO=supercontig / SO=protein_coding / is_pseudo=false